MKGSSTPTFGLSFLKSRPNSLPLTSVSPRSRLNSGRLTLEEVLSDDMLLSFFSDYLEASLCEESLACYRAIVVFRNAGKNVALADWLAKHIFDVFLSSTATVPVNVEATIRLALCDAYEQANKSVSRDFFDSAADALQKLMIQDCMSRFFQSRQYDAHKALVASIGKMFPKLPTAREVRLRILQSHAGKYAPLPSMMEDLVMVEGKAGVRGTLVCNCSVPRAIKFIVDAKNYSDWIPDVDSSTLVSSHGSFLSVFKVVLSSGSALSLGVVRLQQGVTEGCLAWDSLAGSKEADGEVTGGFSVSLCDSNFSSMCRIEMLIKSKGKVKAAKLVESVLLGLRMAVGSSVEARPADLEEDLQFLKKL